MRNFFNYLAQYQTHTQLDERKISKSAIRPIQNLKADEAVRNFFDGSNVRYEVITTCDGFNYQATVVDNAIKSLPEFEKEVRSVLNKTLATMNLVAQTCVTRERGTDDNSLLVKIHVK